MPPLWSSTAVAARQVQNPNVLNPVTGKPVAWKLMPGTPCPPMLAHVRREREAGEEWVGTGWDWHCMC